jgi:predicted O-linked N-acetylglucosamine transferase (SPINDLY family)
VLLPPAFDKVLAEILEKDADAEVVLFLSASPVTQPTMAHQRLLRRLRKRLRHHAMRVRLLPPLTPTDRRDLLQMSTCLLDPHPGTALVPALEALTWGCPVLSRGAMAGVMDLLGVTGLGQGSGGEQGLTAHVEAALRLAEDRRFRAEVVRAIKAGVEGLLRGGEEEEGDLVVALENLVQAVPPHRQQSS